MYWVSVGNPAVEMSSLNGTGRVKLFNESKASYTGVTLYKDSLYISDSKRRSAFLYRCSIVTCTEKIKADFCHMLLMYLIPERWKIKNS